MSWNRRIHGFEKKSVDMLELSSVFLAEFRIAVRETAVGPPAHASATSCKWPSIRQ